MSMPVIISVTGMLHLHAGIHLDEEELAVLVQKLERACAAITNLAAGFGATFADLVALARIEQRCGRFLDDLLVAALHRAVALAQIDRVAVLVGQHLELDMARVFQEFFHVHHGVIERGLRLGLRHGHRIQQVRLRCAPRASRARRRRRRP